MEIFKFFVGRERKEQAVFPAVVLLSGSEVARKSGTEGLFMRATEPVRTEVT